MFHPFRKAVKCVLLLGLPGFGLCLGLTADVQAAQQLIDVGCIGGTVVLHKDEPGCFADIISSVQAIEYSEKNTVFV